MAPKGYLIVNNIGKRENVKSLVQSSIAFGMEVLIAGQPSFAVETHVPLGISSRLALLLKSHVSNRDDFHVHQFASLEECTTWVHDQGALVVGVEIVEDAVNVEQSPFAGSSAFLMGNEGSGMSARQKRCCDSFIIISQYGGGTASLNVAVACTLVLERFWSWTNQSQQT
ncbi:unnamed protein product [Chrysoparadoxa australica]